MTRLTAIVPESARNIAFLGHSNLGGRPDGVQVMVNKGYAFVGHPFSGGASVVDVRDPRRPKLVNYLPTHPRSWSLHCQSHGDLVLVAEEFNFIAEDLRASGRASHAGPSGSVAKFGQRGADYTAGLRVYDISRPADPQPIGFMEMEGLGLHRVWWAGERYAYASALLDGFADHILIVIDLQAPERPREVGRWWLPGMWQAGGETHDRPGRFALHHAVVADQVAYCAWRDAGVILIDVADAAAPKFISQRNCCPPFAGGTHTALPLPDRDLLLVADEALDDISVEPMKYIWIFDIREPKNPVSISTLPTPSDQDYKVKGGQFGPHNLWENRPDAFVSSNIIFATYQNAGVRVMDIVDPFQPKEIAYFVPPQPERLVDPRPGTKKILHSADVYVEHDGRMYVTDYNAGLYILQMT